MSLPPGANARCIRSAVVVDCSISSAATAAGGVTVVSAAATAAAGEGDNERHGQHDEAVDRKQSLREKA